MFISRGLCIQLAKNPCERTEAQLSWAREELESTSLHDKTCIRVSFQYEDYYVLSFERHPVHSVGNQWSSNLLKSSKSFIDVIKLIAFG